MPSSCLRFAFRIAGLLCAVPLIFTTGCGGDRTSSPHPTPSASVQVAHAAKSAKPVPLSAVDKAAINRMLVDWRYTTRYIKVPPLPRLKWHVLKDGARLPADSLLITDKGAQVVLHVPLVAFRPEFVELVRTGRVLNMRVFGDQLAIDVASETLYPVRAGKDMLAQDGVFNATADQVKGAVIYCSDRDALARYAALDAHNPPFPKDPKDARSPELAEDAVHVKKGLGIRGKDLSELGTVALHSMHFNTNQGVYVDAVIPGTPASRSGMQPHDAIVRFNDQPIHDHNDLTKAVDAAPAGKPVNVEVMRFVIDAVEARSFKLSVSLGEFRGNANVVPPPPPGGQ